MKNIRIKNWVFNTLLVILVAGIIFGTVIVTNSLFKALSPDNNSYVLRDILSEAYPVNRDITNMLSRPYTSDQVTEIIGFYSKEKNEEEKTKSIILYDRTYMPSTGILYGSDENFEVVSILDGEVTNITSDDIFNTCIEITHSDNIISKYYSLSEVNVMVGDMVSSGDIIGKSGVNKVSTEKANMLLFELIHNGVSVDPNNYYDKTVDEMR